MLFEELRVFLAVVDRGSLSRAAEELRMARSTIRRRVMDLEERFGHELLERGVDGVTITAAGERLVGRARHVLAEADDLVATASADDAQPEGQLVIAVPTGMPVLLPSLLHRILAQRYPKLTFDFRVHPEPALAVAEDADLGIQFGDSSHTGPWVCHTLAHVPQRLLATPDYLAKHGHPTSVDALRDHRLLVWQGPNDSGRHLTTAGGTRFEVDPYVVSNHAHLVRVLANNGAGIAWALDQPLPEADAQGTNTRLEVVLPGAVERRVPVASYVAAGRRRSPRARAAVEFVVDLLGGLLGQTSRR